MSYQLPVTSYQLPITNYQCSMPHAQCPIPHSHSLFTFLKEIVIGMFCLYLLI